MIEVDRSEYSRRVPEPNGELLNENIKLSETIRLIDLDYKSAFAKEESIFTSL